MQIFSDLKTTLNTFFKKFALGFDSKGNLFNMLLLFSARTRQTARTPHTVGGCEPSLLSLPHKNTHGVDIEVKIDKEISPRGSTNSRI